MPTHTIHASGKSAAERLYEFVRSSPKAVRSREIAAALELDITYVSSVLSVVKRTYPAFTKVYVGKVAYYSLGDVDLSHRELFVLPKDLWRGWVNPHTGIIPSKLGL